jgi:hypothetical protein
MKSSRAEVLKRVEQIYELRLGGAEFPDIYDHANAPEQQWNVSRSQVRRYVRAADRLMKKRFDAKAPHLLSRHLLQRRKLFAHAMAAGDYRTALATLDSEAKLAGLFPPTRIAPTNPEGTAPYAPPLSAADRAIALAALYAAVGAGGGGPVAVQPAAATGPAVGHAGGDPHGRGAGPRPLANGTAAPPGGADAHAVFTPER